MVIVNSKHAFTRTTNKKRLIQLEKKLSMHISVELNSKMCNLMCNKKRVFMQRGTQHKTSNKQRTRLKTTNDINILSKNDV